MVKNEGVYYTYFMYVLSSEDDDWSDTLIGADGHLRDLRQYSEIYNSDLHLSFTGNLTYKNT